MLKGTFLHPHGRATDTVSIVSNMGSIGHIITAPYTIYLYIHSDSCHLQYLCSENPNTAFECNIYSILLCNIDFPHCLLVQEDGRMIPVLYSGMRIYTPVKTSKSQRKLNKVTVDTVLS